MKPLKIIDIMYYGRMYPPVSVYGEGKNRCSMPTRVEKWFYPPTNEVLYLDDLIQKGVCTNSDKEMVLTRMGYIRLFEVDVIAVEREFVSKIGDIDLLNHFQNTPDEEYDYKFNVFLDRYMHPFEWKRFEDDILRNAAIKWCIQHGLDYIDVAHKRFLNR